LAKVDPLCDVRFTEHLLGREAVVCAAADAEVRRRVRAAERSRLDMIQL
jgi:hypothetical protein